MVKNGADVNANGKNGYTALMLASFKGCLEIIEYLVGKGADVNAKNGNNGNTALIMASKQGHHEILKYLLENGAEVIDKDKNG